MTIQHSLSNVSPGRLLGTGMLLAVSDGPDLRLFLRVEETRGF